MMFYTAALPEEISFTENNRVLSFYIYVIMAFSIVTFYNCTVQEMLEVYGIVAKQIKTTPGPIYGGATL